MPYFKWGVIVVGGGFMLAKVKTITYEEFLDIQQNYEGKVEYNNGEVIYMSPSS
jgi:Uma2 family endonuclease